MGDIFAPTEHRDIPLEQRYRGEISTYLRQALNQPEIGVSKDMLAHQLGFINSINSERKLLGDYAGKASRGTLTLLTVDATGGDWKSAVPAAAAIELLHNSTLIFDDIQDNDEDRRGMPTVWKVFGINQAINAGLAMLELSNLTLQDLTERGYDPKTVSEVAQRLATTGITVANGQIMDIGMESGLGANREAYRKMVRHKTASLITASVLIGLDLGHPSDETREALSTYADSIGDCYQIADDLRGVWSTKEQTGKREQGDIARKKQSYPVVVAYEKADDVTRQRLAHLYQTEGELSESEIAEILSIFDRMKIRDSIESGIHLLHGYALRAAKAAGIEDWAKRDYIRLANQISLKPQPELI